MLSQVESGSLVETSGMPKTQLPRSTCRIEVVGAIGAAIETGHATKAAILGNGTEGRWGRWRTPRLVVEPHAHGALPRMMEGWMDTGNSIAVGACRSTTIR